MASSGTHCSCGGQHSPGKTCCSFCHVSVPNQKYADHLDKHRLSGRFYKEYRPKYHSLTQLLLADGEVELVNGE